MIESIKWFGTKLFNNIYIYPSIIYLLYYARIIIIENDIYIILFLETSSLIDHKYLPINLFNNSAKKKKKKHHH